MSLLVPLLWLSVYDGTYDHGTFGFGGRQLPSYFHCYIATLLSSHRPPQQENVSVFNTTTISRILSVP